MATSLNDALTITEQPEPFAIKFVTCDIARKKGGDIIELNKAVRVGTSHNRKVNDTIAVKQTGNTHHPHTVHNHLILEINNQEIYI